MGFFTWLQISLLVIILYWLGASLLAYRIAKNCFVRARKLQSRQIPQAFKAFVRKNITPSHEKSIIKGCFTRFPIHFGLMASHLATFTFLALLNLNLKFPKVLVQLYRQYVGRLVFKICINTVEQFDVYEKITTPIVISNHTSWIQTVYFGSLPHLISSIGKQQIKKMPIMGTLTRYNRCLYVKRQDSDSRQQTLQKIKERANNFINNLEPCPLVIYAEGTVSNGKSLLKFRSGAFEPLMPITIFSFQFQCEQFDPQMADVKLAESFLISLCVRPSLRVKKAIITPFEGQTVAEYQQRCRQKLAAMGSFKIYDSSFKELKQFMNFISQSSDGQLKMS